MFDYQDDQGMLDYIMNCYHNPESLVKESIAIDQFSRKSQTELLAGLLRTLDKSRGMKQ